MSPTRSNSRLIRFVVFALILFGCGYILAKGSSYNIVPSNIENIPNEIKKGDSSNQSSQSTSTVQNNKQEVTNVGLAELKPKTESKGKKVNATFVTLARNSDLYSLLGSIRHIEDRFNKKFKYDWVFLNDEEFSEEFKETTTALISGKTKYGLIPREHWSYPEWIDKEKAALAREDMANKNVIYGGSESYRHMCRYESGFFWRHELMMNYTWYWRVEPDIRIYCDIDYDVFKWMEDNGKMYSFAITLPEYKETILTLWDATKDFIKKNPQYVAENNLMNWISNDDGTTYNRCHFWSNFEIANLEFWRSEAYTKYFEHLDRAGGFFYERWGDAPIHSIAVSLFLPQEKVHFFDDIGYYHGPFHNCPISKDFRYSKKCVCNPHDDFTWKGYSCTGKYFTIKNLKRPSGWENFS